MNIKKIGDKIKQRLDVTQDPEGRKALQRFLCEINILEGIMEFDHVHFKQNRNEVEDIGKGDCYLKGDYVVIATKKGRYELEWFAYVTPIDIV